MKKLNLVGIFGCTLCVSEVVPMKENVLPRMPASREKVFNQIQEEGIGIQDANVLLESIDFGVLSRGFLEDGLTVGFLQFIDKIRENVLIGKGFAPLRYYRKELLERTLAFIANGNKPASDFVQKVSLACYFVGDLFRLCDSDSLFKKHVFPILKRRPVAKVRTIRGIDRRIVDSWLETCKFLLGTKFSDVKDEIWSHLYYNGLVNSMVPRL
jgi:hypothetical protein